jgi:hypothetical protein
MIISEIIFTEAQRHEGRPPENRSINLCDPLRPAFTVTTRVQGTLSCETTFTNASSIERYFFMNIISIKIGFSISFGLTLLSGSLSSFRENNGLTAASSLAFSAMLALIPTLFLFHVPAQHGDRIINAGAGPDAGDDNEAAPCV